MPDRDAESVCAPHLRATLLVFFNTTLIHAGTRQSVLICVAAGRNYFDGSVGFAALASASVNH